MTVEKECNVHLLAAKGHPEPGDLLLRHIWKNRPNLECISLWRYKGIDTINGLKVYTVLDGSFMDTPELMRRHHLYITSNDEIKEGDCCIYQHPKHDRKIVTRIVKWNYSESKAYEVHHEEGFGVKEGYKKIIATTDKSLWEHDDTVSYPRTKKFPEPSKHFIKKYIEEFNKGNVITKVMVEYEPYCIESKNDINLNPKRFQGVKVNSANQIIISKIKDSWNKEEVINLLEKWTEDISPGFGGKLISTYYQDLHKWIEENL